MFGLFRKKSAAAEKIENKNQAEQDNAGHISGADNDVAAETAAVNSNKNWLDRLKSGLSRSATQLTAQIDEWVNKRKIGAESLQELEDILIAADLGIGTSQQIVAEFGAKKFPGDIDGVQLRRELASIIAAKMRPYTKTLAIDAGASPYVILVIGVNGAGKTTTIGKMTQNLHNQGYRVMLAAADTFRAAATEQLDVWCKRTKTAHFFYRPNVTDPAALAFEALNEAKRGGFDVLIVDTAGRLHTKTNLMQELEKIPRVLKKLDEKAPHESLLVLDATTGQNAIAQAEHFNKSAPLTGLIVTKLDGTARGGVVLTIAEKTKIPVVAIGVGEGIDDLQPFDPQSFAENLLKV